MGSIIKDKLEEEDEKTRALKAYYITICEKFNLLEGQEIKEPIQQELYEKIDVNPTTIIKNIGNYQDDLQMIKVVHQMKIKQSGFIFLNKEENFEKIEFKEFLHTAIFHCYYININNKNIFLLQASKHIKKDFIKKIKHPYFAGYLSLIEKNIDFHKLPKSYDELNRVYFKKIRTDISHATIGGNIDPNNNDIYEQFSQLGEISAISLLYPFKNYEHKIMITLQSGIILLEKYDDINEELELIKDIITNLLLKIWR
ncbi:MAG: hypothetical protein ACYCTB_05550 [bacterium]